MSVKGKVKRLNKEIIKLQDELETERLSNSRLRQKLDEKEQSVRYIEQLENIVKFAVTNHIGNLRGGIRIARPEIYKLNKLKLSIEQEPMYDSYVIKVDY